MKVCDYCGTEVANEVTECPSCAANQFSYKCPLCGKLYSQGVFCSECGAKLNVSTEEEKKPEMPKISVSPQVNSKVRKVFTIVAFVIVGVAILSFVFGLIEFLLFFFGSGQFFDLIDLFKYF